MDRNFFIFVVFINLVKKYIEVCHAGHVGQYASFGVFGYRAFVNADAFAVGHFFYEREQFFELRRPGSTERVCSGRDEVVRIFEGSAGSRFILEGEDKGSRHCFARRAISL